MEKKKKEEKGKFGHPKRLRFHIPGTQTVHKRFWLRICWHSTITDRMMFVVNFKGRSFLFCPCWDFPVFPGFSDLSGDGPEIFPIDPVPLSLGLSTAPTRRNSLETVRDAIRSFHKKMGNPPVWKPPGLPALKN